MHASRGGEHALRACSMTSIASRSGTDAAPSTFSTVTPGLSFCLRRRSSVRWAVCLEARLVCSGISCKHQLMCRRQYRHCSCFVEGEVTTASQQLPLACLQARCCLVWPLGRAGCKHQLMCRRQHRLCSQFVDGNRVTDGHQSPLRAYKHGYCAQVCMPKGSHCNTVIATARICKLQPPEGGQAAIPSPQLDSATVAPFLSFAANARQCPLKVTRQRRCRQAQSLQMFFLAEASSSKGRWWHQYKLTS